MGGSWLRWTVVGVAVLTAACSDAPTPSAEPTSSPTASIFLEERERPKVQAALDDFFGAFEEGDWETAVSLMTRDSVAFFAELREATATAGPNELRDLGNYRWFAATVLRAEEGAAEVGDMSDEELVAALYRNGVLGTGSEFGLELTEPIRVFGDSAAVFVPQGGGAAWELDFNLEDGRWKVDVEDIVRIVGDTIEDSARARGRRVQNVILDTASAVVRRRLTPAIWAPP